jgi:hypothetical protein
MRNVKRFFFFLLAGLVSAEACAHTLDWMENPSSLTPNNPMVFYYPRELSGKFYVDPSYYEPCTVVVNLNVSTSTLINAQVLPPNPANSVTVVVQILRAPSNHLENATITGEWHATGLPPGNGCDALSPNPFSVPITVTDQSTSMQIYFLNGAVTVTGPNALLQYSSCLDGPWFTFARGPSVTFPKMMPTVFFQQTKEVGKFVAGVILDNSSMPVPNLSIGLQYDGTKTFSDFGGTYSLPRLPLGINWLSYSNSNGANLNLAVSNSVNTSSNAFTPAMVKIAMAAAPLVAATNSCNCTPWVAIGFATLPDGRSPVYYAGGANAPNGGTPDCGQPVVTVTPPAGAPFTISAGSGHHHNSGANPASGTWTVTAVVCGQTKTATVTVP